MNIYGSTKCPECKVENYMYRPLEGRGDSIRNLIAWDEVRCWQCKHEYLHTMVIDNQYSKKD